MPRVSVAGRRAERQPKAGQPVASGHRERETAPPIETALGLLAVVLLIAGNGFFVAAEFSLVAVDRTRVDQLAETGSRRARLVATLLPRLSFHLSGAQLGITITTLVLGFIAEPTIAQIIDPAVSAAVGDAASRGVSIALALAVATVVQMVAGELIPKSIAIARPLGTALVLGAPVRIYGSLFGPLIRFLDAAANATVRRLGIEPRDELASVRSLSELELLFEASAREGTLDERSGTLLARSIRFGEKTAADVLVPRVSIVALDDQTTAPDVVELSGKTGHSRFPVYGEDLDDVRGVVHVKSVHQVPLAERATTPVTSMMTDVLALPETLALEDVLFAAQESRSHLVVVVDEYGGTAGIITLEDMVEEIVGDIADEYDAPSANLTLVYREGEWLLPGTLHGDEVEEICGFVMPEGDYETIAGFVLDRLGHIPERPGDEVHHDGWTLAVAVVEGRRIATVRMVSPPADGAEEPDR
jgi:CBS domain containing-hemolysin-like protein